MPEKFRDFRDTGPWTDAACLPYHKPSPHRTSHLVDQMFDVGLFSTEKRKHIIEDFPSFGLRTKLWEISAKFHNFYLGTYVWQGGSAIAFHWCSHSTFLIKYAFRYELRWTEGNIENEKNYRFVITLPLKPWNLENSRFFSADYVKEMYQIACCTGSTISFPHSSNRRRPSWSSLIWLVERVKINVLHVQHTLKLVCLT